MIAFLISGLAIKGGTHKQLLKLLEYTNDKGVDFKVITANLNFEKTYPGFKKFEKRIVEIKHKKSSGIWDKIRSHYRYNKLLKKAVSDVSIVNIHDGGFEKYLSAFNGKKLYWQVNDLPTYFQEGVAKEKRVTLKERFIKYSLLRKTQLIDEFVVNVSKNRDRIQRHFNRDAKVFYPGIDSIGFKRDNNQSYERFSRKEINLLSSGVFYPYRNYEVQVRVVKLLKNKGYKIKLNIFGSIHSDNGYYKLVQGIINNEGLENEINILGQISDEMYLKLHKESDFFLFTNIDQSWGLAVFEAMSCGMPVIVSKSVGAVEILDNDINSIWVNPQNENEIERAITKLVENVSNYEEISNEAIQFASSITWDEAYCSRMLNLMTNNGND